MMYKAFLVKYAEIGIKGKNRHLFALRTDGARACPGRRKFPGHP